MEERIRRVLRDMGVSASDQVVRALGDWLDRLVAWNQRIDLTAARGDDELVDLMIADAAMLATRIGERARVVDVGSGAGAPGLPLALLRSDLDVTLVEPLQKRVAFLRSALGAVPPGSVHARVVRARGEELARHVRFDVAISRATLPPARWLTLGADLGDEIWVLLAREEPPSRRGWSVADDVHYTWPLTRAERRALLLRRSPHRGVREQADEGEDRDEPDRGGEEEKA